MALTAATYPVPHVTDPTAPLGDALAAFERALTDAQRQKYHNSAGRPDASDVIAFVTQIDTDNQSRASKCVASRLSTFLQATQQFVGVVDTFVDSNPAIAALVWGSVKFTIISVSNVVSYFDQVTELIMSTGKLCPLYQQFGKLYAGSVELQRALCEYYATIIRLCVKIIEVSQRKALAQIIRSAWTPFTIEFKGFRDELEQSAKVVDLQISLASKQVNSQVARLLAFEHKENQKHRLLSLASRSETKQEREEARQWRLWHLARERSRLRLRIKENLSSADHLKAWRHIYQQRAPQTAEWLQQDPEFLDWTKQEQSKIMWCPGTLGVGKTVLAANVVAYLLARHTSYDIVSYHFCRWEDKASLSARSILGSLARQLLEAQIDLLNDSELSDMSRATENLEAGDIVDFVLPRLQDCNTYYIVLDGIDESDFQDIEIVAASIARLRDGRSCNLKIVYTGRPELENRLLRVAEFDYRITISRSKVLEDVEKYSMITLNQCLENGKLKLNDPTLILQISETLKGESEEIFLWTKLFIEEMCAQQTDNEILGALQNPPRKISELIDRKLARVTEHNGAIQAVQILQYCGVLKTPLNMNQFRELLTIVVGQEALDRKSLPNDMAELVTACHGLIFMDQEDETLHYAHHSIWNHILTSKRLHADITTEAELDVHLGNLCLTYLNFTDFQRQLKRQKESFTVPIRPIHFGIASVTRSTGLVAQVAQKLLRHQDQFKGLSGREMEQRAQEILGESVSSRLEAELRNYDYSFLAYARKQWLHHFARLDKKLDSRLWDMFSWCIQDDNILALKPWHTEPKPVNSAREDEIKLWNIFEWSVDHENLGLLLYMVLTHWSDLTEKEGIMLISKKAFLRHRCLILPHILSRAQFGEELLAQTFFNAAATGQDEVLQLCLELGVSVDLKLDPMTLGIDRLSRTNVQNFGRTALYSAAKAGHPNIVEKLLSAGADVNTWSDIIGNTALHAAAQFNHLAVVEKLLTAGANVDPISRADGVTPLYLAAERGNLDVVEALLSASASVHNRATISAFTALQAAAMMGHLGVVRRLLAAGAAHGGQPTDPQRALRLAAHEGHLAVVEDLLSAGIDVQAVDSSEWNALSAAVDGGHYSVVQKLLLAGANVNVSFVGKGIYMTLVELAEQEGYEEIRTLLIKSGAKGYNWPHIMTGDPIALDDDDD